MLDGVLGGQNVTFAAGLAAVTFFLYFLKALVEALGDWRQERRRAERLVCALYAEIQANVEDLQEFLDQSPALDRVKQAVRENSSLQPHFTGTEHTLVYERHLGELANLPRTVIFKVVAFYSQLERITTIIDSLELSSFENISGEGRAQVMDELWRSMERGVKLGKEVMHGLEINAPLELVNTAIKPR